MQWSCGHPYVQTVETKTGGRRSSDQSLARRSNRQQARQNRAPPSINKCCGVPLAKTDAHDAGSKSMQNWPRWLHVRMSTVIRTGLEWHSMAGGMDAATLTKTAVRAVFQRKRSARGIAKRSPICGFAMIKAHRTPAKMSCFRLSASAIQRIATAKRSPKLPQLKRQAIGAESTKMHEERNSFLRTEFACQLARYLPRFKRNTSAAALRHIHRTDAGIFGRAANGIM